MTLAFQCSKSLEPEIRRFADGVSRAASRLAAGAFPDATFMFGADAMVSEAGGQSIIFPFAQHRYLSRVEKAVISNASAVVLTSRLEAQRLAHSSLSAVVVVLAEYERHSAIHPASPLDRAIARDFVLDRPELSLALGRIPGNDVSPEEVVALAGLEALVAASARQMGSVAWAS